MKKILGFLIMGSILLMGCGNHSKSQKISGSESDPNSIESGDSKTNESIENNVSAICLWPKVGLRDQPGIKKTKYLTTIYFGETVEFLNEKKQADDKKEYLKIRLSDGTEGWVYEYLFAVGGKLAIVNKETALYKRPDIMTFEGEKLEPMDMVVIFEDEEQEEWHQVTSLKKEKKGWIQGEISTIQDEIDVKLGILYWRAMEESTEKKFELLENILANPNFKKSKLIDHVSKALYENEGKGEAFYIEELDTFENLSSNQLGIKTDVADIRSSPNIEEDNVLFQVEKGDICNIIAQGNSLEKVGNNTDRWYKINYNGQEGWVFGYNTNKRRP